MYAVPRLSLVLVAAAALAGCADAVTAPLASADAQAPSGACGGEEPILHSLAQLYCGEEPPPGDPGDPGDPGNPVDPGNPGGVPPFEPPPQPFEYDTSLPIYWGGSGGTLYSCGQTTKASWGFSNDVYRGTTIYLAGITVPHTRVNWRIYDASGQLVYSHLSQPSRSNCVVHHEPEAVSTWGFAPGYYYLYASYMGLQYYGVESAYGYPTGIQGKYAGVLRVR